jgi:integrase
MAELCDLYLMDLEAGRIMTRRGHTKKASTVTTDVSRIAAHIKPLLGSLKVREVTAEDVERFMHDVAEGKTALRRKTGRARGLSNIRGGQGAASRTVGLLGALFSYAVRKRLRADNPVRGIIRFADGRRERRLSDAEYSAFGQALTRADQEIWPAAVAAARFLLLTGWRSGETLALKWTEVDLPRRTAVPDTKSGRSTRPLSEAACKVISGMPQTSEFIFAASRGSGVMTGFASLFRKVVGFENLPEDVTPHVLRHSFASLAADLGFSEPTIAALIGHKGQSVTSRYVHSADAVLLAAADDIAREVERRSFGTSG